MINNYHTWNVLWFICSWRRCCVGVCCIESGALFKSIIKGVFESDFFDVCSFVISRWRFLPSSFMWLDDDDELWFIEELMMLNGSCFIWVCGLSWCGMVGRSVCEGGCCCCCGSFSLMWISVCFGGRWWCVGLIGVFSVYYTE